MFKYICGLSLERAPFPPQLTASVHGLPPAPPPPHDCDEEIRRLLEDTDTPVELEPQPEHASDPQAHSEPAIELQARPEPVAMPALLPKPDSTSLQGLSKQALSEAISENIARYLGSGAQWASKPVPMLSKLIATYISNMKLGTGVVGSIKDAAHALGMLLKLVGDKPIDLVSTDDIHAFADVLSRLPPKCTSQAGYADMRLQEIAALAKTNGIKPIELSTQHKHIRYLHAFFSWCMASKDLQDNPMRRLQMSRYANPNPGTPSRAPFTSSELERILCRQETTKCEAPHFFWAPRIALFTGMRTNEICQLYVADVVEIANRWCFDIRPKRKGQHLKTINCERYMPIHPKLLELGFVDYLNDVKAAGCKHLFPGLNWDGSGPGKVMSNNYRRVLNDLGITDPTRTFHSFRYTLATLANRSDVTDTVIIRLLGHKPGDSVLRRFYISRADVRECAEALARIQFPSIDFEPYNVGRFKTYLRNADKMAASRKAKRKAKRVEKQALESLQASS